jgi:dihydrofolate synthase/folylpolyglutamate synthase
MTVGLAFDYFAKEKVDIAVTEVGMGGRLDSTNVITPLLSVITNIGLDHTQFLGDTLEKIAGEKAGIIKDGVHVVIGETQLETAPVFVKTAANHHAPITFADQHYVVDDISRYTEELTGEYQKKNIATVLEAVEVLRKTTDFELQPKAVRKGLAKVVTNTHLHGRWQKIGESPLTICETAHNAPGIDSMLGKLATMDYDNLHVVYGCVNDKDYRKILNHLNTEFSRLGKPFRWYFSQPSVPRGLPVADLLAAASEQGIEGKGYEKVKDAIAEARSTACKDDFVLVTGSIFLIADALA